VCFLDLGNMYSHMRDTFGSGKYNISKLCHEVKGRGRKLTAIRCYGAPLPQGTTAQEHERYAGQQRFFAALRRNPRVTLRLGRFQVDRETGTLREKGVDVMLAVDLVRLAMEGAYDVAILLSGDGDLVPAVETVRQVCGRRVEVAIPPVDAFHIRQAADAYVEITAATFSKVAM
jgi:uncharacterized LabA/DUF88 family protein